MGATASTILMANSLAVVSAVSVPGVDDQLIKINPFLQFIRPQIHRLNFQEEKYLSVSLGGLPPTKSPVRK